MPLQVVQASPYSLQGYGPYESIQGGVVVQQPQGGGGGTTSSSGNNGYYGGSSYSAPVIDTAKIAQYDQEIGQLNAANSRLDSFLNSGYSTIDSSWQDALNNLLLGKNQTKQNYDQNKQSTTKEYVGAKNTILSNAGNSLNGLLRLLGSRGAGGSSTARVLLPGAVTRQATLQRNEVSGTNAANNRALDQAWGNYELGYNNQVSSANSQRNQKRQALENDINTKRGDLLNQIAQLAGQRSLAAGGNATGAAAPYLAQANAAYDRAANYSVSPVAVSTVPYAAPDLSTYAYDPGSAPTVQGQGQANDYTSPYLAALLGKRQQTVGA